jgi:hypothetical protein
MIYIDLEKLPQIHFGMLRIFRKLNMRAEETSRTWLKYPLLSKKVSAYIQRERRGDAPSRVVEKAPLDPTGETSTLGSFLQMSAARIHAASSPSSRRAALISTREMKCK